MKVTIEQIQNGLTKYIDNEMVSQFDGWQKIGLGTVMALIINNLPKTLEMYRNNAIVKMLDIIDDNNQIDIEQLYNALYGRFSDSGENINIPMLGEVKFTKQDVDNLYHYIKGE